MVDLKALLRVAVERKASDLHLKVGSPPHVRIQGELVPITTMPAFRREDTNDLVQQLLTPRQREVLNQRSEVDLAFGAAGLGRFRVAVFQQRGSVSFVFRLIPEPATLALLGLGAVWLCRNPRRRRYTGAEAHGQVRGPGLPL